MLARAGVVAGTVVDPADNEPVRKAIVTLTWQGTPRAWATSRTDSSGAFRFEGLPAGKYELRATKEGIGTAIYGATSLREPGESISLRDGETRAGLKLLFLRFANVSGRVFDPEGAPLRGAVLTMLRLGARNIAKERDAVTDDRGEYSIGNVAPGRYYVYAGPPEPGVSGSPGPMMIPQFLGGARTSKGSTILKVTGGEVVTGIDFNMTAEPLGRIHGHVVAAPDLPGAPESPPTVSSLYEMGAIVVSLMPIDDNLDERSIARTVLPPDYDFDFGDLAPNRYRLEALVQRDGRSWGASQMVDPARGADDLILSLAPAPDMKGTLRIEGTALPPAAGFKIQLLPYEMRPVVEGQIAANGSFTLPQVTSGEWFLRVTELASGELPSGAFFKSVRLGDKELRYQRLAIEPGSPEPLHIVISTNTAQIHGAVDGKAGILLVPSGEFHPVESLYYSAATDSDGKFSLDGIAPGKYKVFALEKTSAEDFKTPEAADQLDTADEEIDLAEGASLEVHPKLIPMERAREALP